MRVLKYCAFHPVVNMRFVNNYNIFREACSSYLAHRPKPLGAMWSQKQNQRSPIFRLRTALPEDRARVEDFLNSHYYREEPLRTGAAPIGMTKDDMDFHLDKLHQGYTVLAVRPDYDDLIVGAAVAAPKVRWELEILSDKYDINSKWGRILKIWARAEKEAAVFERYALSRLVHAYALAVHKKYRGYNLGSRMLAELAEIARKHKFETLTMDATSNHAACACSKNGWRWLNTLAYVDHKDKMGKTIFTPKSPHDAIRTYVLRLQ